jgi:hypothetical protein
MLGQPFVDQRLKKNWQMDYVAAGQDIMDMLRVALVKNARLGWNKLTPIVTAIWCCQM